MSRTAWPYSSPRRAPARVPKGHEGSLPARPKRLRRGDGSVVEVYYIGALAQALGKTAFTVRRWEREGFLPETPLVYRIRGGAPRRLYTGEQILRVAAIAEEEGLAFRKPVELTRTNFTARVKALYAELFPKHF